MLSSPALVMGTDLSNRETLREKSIMHGGPAVITFYILVEFVSELFLGPGPGKIANVDFMLALRRRHPDFGVAHFCFMQLLFGCICTLLCSVPDKAKTATYIAKNQLWVAWN